MQVKPVVTTWKKPWPAMPSQIAYLQPDDMLYVPSTKLASAGELCTATGGCGVASRVWVSASATVSITKTVTTKLTLR